MESLILDGRQTIIVALLVLFLGKLLIGKIAFLRNYNIPEPVVGGLMASLIFDLSSLFETLMQGGAQLACPEPLPFC